MSEVAVSYGVADRRESQIVAVVESGETVDLHLGIQRLVDPFEHVRPHESFTAIQDQRRDGVDTNALHGSQR